MGLKSIIQQAVSIAMAVTGGPDGVVENVTYIAPDYGYDRTLGKANPGKEYPNIPALAYDPDSGSNSSTEETSGTQSTMGDLPYRAFFIEQKNLTVRPQEQGTVISAAGVKYTIVRIGEDPAHASWTIFARSK